MLHPYEDRSIIQKIHSTQGSYMYRYPKVRTTSCFWNIELQMIRAKSPH
jgi:hypothetical protein